VRLAGGAADVDPVRPRPSHDGQAARALVAAVRRARVADQRVAHAAGEHRARQRRGRDELVALAVGEDQHRTPVAGDERARLGRRADRHLVGGAGGVGVQEGRQGSDPCRRHRSGTPGHLDPAAHGGHRRGEREGKDRAQRDGAREARGPRARADGERHARSQAGRDGGIDAGQVARAQAGHRAAQREAGDEPEREGEKPAAADAVQAARSSERQRNSERRQSGHGLDADPAAEVGLRGQQPQRPGGRRAASEGGDVLARAAGERVGGP
jgi:hypothetical protein